MEELRADPATAERADALLTRLNVLMRDRDLLRDPDAEREAIACIDQWLELAESDLEA